MMAKYNSKKFVGLFNFGTGRQTLNRVSKMTKIPKDKLRVEASFTGLGFEVFRK